MLGETPLTHLGAYMSICTVPNVLGIDREEFMYPQPGRLVFAYSTGPDAPAQVGLAFASPELSYDRRDVAGQRLLIRQAFADGGWEVPRLLDVVDAAGDLYFDSISQVHLPRWSAGRVALIGDAAHCPSPASGQGTSMALVGAYVLAEKLAAADGHEAAFERYETAMRPYAEMNLAFGRKMAKDMVPRSAWRIAVQNYGMRTLKYHPRRERVIERVLRPLHEAANAIAI